MRRVAGACIVAGLLAVFAAGCGGSTTTIIERTVTVEANKAPSGPALLKLPAYEHWEVEPTIYAFGVSGALAGHDLKWSEWGHATARGVGRIWERDPDGDFDQYRKFPGEVVATGLRECEGRQFYTEVSAQAEGLGTDPIELATPCTGGAPFDPSAVSTQRPKLAEAKTRVHCGCPNRLILAGQGGDQRLGFLGRGEALAAPTDRREFEAGARIDREVAAVNLRRVRLSEVATLVAS